MFPLGDWQFWVVSVAVAAAAVQAVRMLLPRRKRKSGRRVNLTVSASSATPAERAVDSDKPA